MQFNRPKIWNIFHKLLKFQTIWCRRRQAHKVKRLGILALLLLNVFIIHNKKINGVESQHSVTGVCTTGILPLWYVYIKLDL